MAVAGTEAVILDTLMRYLAGRTFDPEMKVAQPGVAFSPKLNAPYLRAAFLPNGSRADSLAFDSDRTHIGLLVVTVVWPAGQGFVRPYQVAAQVRVAFDAGTRIPGDGLTVAIDEEPQTGGVLDDAPWIGVPVTIRWRVGTAAGA